MSCLWHLLIGLRLRHGGVYETRGDSNPPLRLLLGKMALEVARKKLEMLRKDFDTWEATTVGADYPEGE